MHIFDVLSQSRFVSTKERIIMWILEEYSCRISEVLNATWANFYADDFLFLKGAKHSYDVCVTNRSILSLISTLPRLHPQKIFWPTKYHTIHRLCLKYLNDRVRKYQTGKNRKVTHYFRYDKAHKLDNVSRIKLVLHQRSNRSAVIYNPNIME